MTRSGKAGKALEKSRKQVEEGNKEVAQLKVFICLLYILSMFHLSQSRESAFFFVPCWRRPPFHPSKHVLPLVKIVE